MSQTFIVWREGYRVTGNNSGAEKVANITVSDYTSFREACELEFINRSYYDPRRNTLWGCKLFDNEEDARKSFG